MSSTTRTESKPAAYSDVEEHWADALRKDVASRLRGGAPALVRVHFAWPAEFRPEGLLESVVHSDGPVSVWQDAHSGLEVHAVGAAAEASFADGDRFAQARRVSSRWRESLCLIGSGWPQGLPLAWAGFSFARRPAGAEGPWRRWPQGRLVVPRWMIYRLPEPASSTQGAALSGRDAAGQRVGLVVSAWIDDEAGLEAAITDLHLTLAEVRLTLEQSKQAGGSSPNPDDEQALEPRLDAVGDRERWCQLVDRARDSIRASALEKVVMARSVRLKAPQGAHFDVAATLRRLRHQNEAAFVFAFGQPDDGMFVGATPETLVRLRGLSVETQVLAGTTRRGADAAEDEALGRQLMESAKDRHEHALTAQAIASALGPWCDELTIPETPRLARLRRLTHLETPVRGTLREPTDVLTLVECMHPTPAVGGAPRQGALDWLESHEGLERGWYAGPVGWVGAEGDGVFAVAIRSALLRGDTAEAFAGAGIVAASEPTLEWDETGLKLETAGRGLAMKEDA